MRQLDLRCDGIAVLRLQRLGWDAERLVAAVGKVTRDNERRRFTASAEDYVSLQERVAFIRAMAGLSWPPTQVDPR